MKECENVVRTYAKSIKIISYISFLAVCTKDHENVSIRNAQNYYVAINCFYLYIGITLLTKVYNSANNPWFGFFAAALVMPVSDKTAALLLKMKPANVTHNIDYLSL